MTDKELTGAIIGGAIEVHRELGPGLLESAYAECLGHELKCRGIPFERENPIPVLYRDVKLDCGYRADFVVAGRIVVELKAVQVLAPIHEAIMLTYLRLSGCRVGLLINFHVPVLKDGIRRFRCGYSDEERER